MNIFCQPRAGASFLRLGKAWGLVVSCWLLVWSGVAQVSPPPAASTASLTVEIVTTEGKVEVSPAGSDVWQPAKVGQVLKLGDRLRTGRNSRASLRFSNQSVLRVNEGTLLTVQPSADGKTPFLDLLSGSFFLLDRDKPARMNFRTRMVTAAVRGTEFVFTCDDTGKTLLAVLDGAVDLSTADAQINVTNGEQVVVAPGMPPVKTAVINANNLIQWCLYYPGVLDADELNLSADEKTALADSLAAYRQGDLPNALAQYPAARQPNSDPEKIYLAALVLAAGQVDQCAALLDSLAAPSPLAEALRTLIAAVKFQPRPSSHPSLAASEWLAESYYCQSRYQLNEARAAAQKAVAKSPNFGFAWTRLAELEFSFGRVSQASEASAKGLVLAPRNAQAVALKGFLFSAQNKIPAALAHFNQAIEIDNALGNGWLGRGLCKIRQGQAEAGRQDLQVAAALEPQRALLRSYLGKSYSHIGDTARAIKEFDLARQLDAGDPTPLLYRALLGQQENRINEAVDDLERSLELNDNRRVYRSRLLLDQDRAVRGANLATVYEDAGMTDVSVREASRAVNADYANYSAHLFLANSYQALRDPRQINLRYETAWFSEYLMANLLAPAHAGALSPQVSQQEYSRLFERNRLGFASATEYLSRGNWQQAAAQYGIWEGSSYAVDTTYRSLNGWRLNNDLEDTTVSLRLKQELTAKDSLFLQGIYYDYKAGDVAQYYDPAAAYPRVRVKETQKPLLTLGYHHEWNPGSHTLFLGGRWQDTLRVANPDQPLLMQFKLVPQGPVFALPWPALPTADFAYRSDLEGYTMELQHIWKSEAHGLILGGRFQTGIFDLQEQWGSSTPTWFANNTITSLVAFASAPLAQSLRADFQRAGIYGYYQWRILPPLQLTAGLSYDYLNYPLNFRFAPVTDQTETMHRVGPKAGVIWTPFDRTALRAAYARSLGGVSFDQSFRLEPVQVAGFNQAFRSLIPEAIAGANAGERFETWGVALDQQFRSRTYLGIQAEWLNSDITRRLGAVDMAGPPLTFTPATTRENLAYRERNLTLTLNQLVGREWSLGTAYRLSQAHLLSTHPELPAFPAFQADQDNTAILHQLNMFAVFNHRCGFFSRFDALWSQQANRGYSPDIPGDDFWQLNAYIGYRFWQRRAEIKLGILNLANQDYRLNPLNLTSELPRERTFLLNFKFMF